MIVFAWRTPHGWFAAPSQPAHRNLATECRVHRPVASARPAVAPVTRRAIEPPPAASPTEPAPAPRQVPPGRQVPSATPDLAALVERARPLMPLGRGEMAKALGVKPHWARRVIETLNAEQPELRLVAREDRA